MWRHLAATLILLGVASAALAQDAAAAAVPPGGDAYLRARHAQLAGDHQAAIADLQLAAGAEGRLRPFAAQALAEAARAVSDTDLLLAGLATWAGSERSEEVRVEAHRAWGDALAEAGRHREAAAAYAFWVEHAENPRDRSRARWAQAQALRAAGDTAAAEPLLWDIVDDDPSSVQARDALPLLPKTTDIRRRYEIGRVYLRHRQWKEADAWLAPLIDEPLSVAFQAQVLYAWAEAQRHLHSAAAGRSAMYQLALAYPQSGYARKARQEVAGLWARDGDIANAIVAYDEIVDQYPEHDVAVQALWDGAKWLVHSDPAATAERLATLQRAYPGHLLADDALRMRGFVLYSLDRYAEARETFREAHTRYPHRHTADDCAYWEGKCALALGDTDGARDAFAVAAEQWPNDYYGHRAVIQLERLDAAGGGAPAVQLLPASYSPPGDGPNALPFAPEDMELPARAEEWVALFEWLHANGLPEARNVIPHLRRVARTPAQQYRVARFAAAAGDYEATVWLADSVRKTHPEAMHLPEVAALLYPAAWFEDVQTHAEAYGIDPYLPLAVMREESHFRETIDSSAGARGVMQIMPSTGEWLGRMVRGAGAYDHDRLYDVPYSIQLGTYYLGHLLKQFDGNVILAVAAYNAGPGNVKRWVERYGLDDIDRFVESIPYDETIEYVKKVLGSYGTYRRLAALDGTPPDGEES